MLRRKDEDGHSWLERERTASPLARDCISERHRCLQSVKVSPGDVQDVLYRGRIVSQSTEELISV